MKRVTPLMFFCLVFFLFSSATFGQSSKVSVGNLVWNDADGDGKKDPNEYVLRDITVSLYTDNNSDDLPDGAAIASFVTGADGKYLFQNLPAGRYIISIPVIPGYRPGGIASTSYEPDNNVDNDNNGVRADGGLLYSKAITLDPGDEPDTDGDGSSGNNTFDIALCGNSAIGDYVWHDENCNGLQDAGETGINGVAVTITYADGTTKTEITHNYLGHDGYYDFINIGPGNYLVAFTTPAGSTPSVSNVGGDDNIDSDPVNGIVNVTIAVNQSDFTIDAGYCNLPGNLRLGNLVWNDSDGDGKKDPNEYVISGITVSLYEDANADNLPDGPAISTYVTGNDGMYSFTNLAGGKYIISIPVIPGYRPGGIASTSYNPDNDVDNDNNGIRSDAGILYSNSITLSAGAEPSNDGDDANGNLTFDIALCGNSAIGDYVWYDTNCNGIQDAAESGINGALVTITFEDGTTETAVTHNYLGRDGYYDFTNIGPGTYTVAFSTPPGYTPSPSNIGADDAVDSDPVNGSTSVTIVANQSDFTVDAGFCQGGNLNLGNLVWNDSDGDGKKDPNEYAIGGIMVSLYRDFNADNLPDGPAIQTTVTTINGIYNFTGLMPGRYIISIPVLDGYRPGGIAPTSNDPDNNVDNDNNGVRASAGILYSNAITLAEGDEPINDGDGANGNLTFDIALCGNSAIGDYVWFDSNCNGIQDAGENGINDALVTITFADGTTRTAVTHNYLGQDGYYDFTNVGPGSYLITFTTPAGYTPAPANAGADDSVDSDPVNGSVTVSLVANQSDFTIDAGYCQKSAILNLGNLVWNDSDGDGKKDPNEYAIGGITVSLYDDNDGDNLPDGPAIQTTVTNINGIYNFSNLTSGRYIISIPVLPGYRPGGIASSSNNPDNNVDNDNNGVHNVSGVLYSNAITLSEGGEPTTDGDGANGNLTFDIALCGNSAIGDFVWFDANCNGIQDAGELGINDALVTITYADGTTKTEVTHTYLGNSGYYDFINIGPGTYTVTFETPAGFNPSPANAGLDDSKDSDPINKIASVTIAANQSDFTIDAGFCQPSANLSLGNLVWNDSDADGKKDPNEYVLRGITVSLYLDKNADNIPDGPAVQSTTTGADGTYHFVNLNPGRYIISIPILPGYRPGGIAATSDNPDNDVDNDNNGVRKVGSILYSNAITLSTGGEPTTDGDDANGNLTFDIALCGNSAIGDFVWSDLNCNGLQDTGEPGINGVLITITYADGTTKTEVSHTYQGNDGYYSFVNIGPGTYQLHFETPAGYSPSTANAGTDDTKDSDPVNTNTTVTLKVNQSDFTIDAGYCSASGLRLGNLVWNDLNFNGIKDLGEPGIDGATVNLYLDANGDNIPDGPSIASTTTVNGLYGFSGLTEGQYIVGVVVPSGYTTAATTATGSLPDNDIDNDNNGVLLTNGEVRTHFITLSANNEPVNDGDDANGNQTLDVALKGGAVLGDYVWCDLNQNGIQDFNEIGIANTLVTLIFPDGTTRTTLTDILGKYTFSGLGPGTYTIQFATPLGMTPSPANQGSNDAKDSDPVNGEVNVTLQPNESNTTIDAGFYKTPCMVAAGTCGPGYLTLQTSLIRNGDFSSPVTSPAAGTVFSGGSATSGITYNFSFGSFIAQAGYAGENVVPGDNRTFSIITSATNFTAPNGVNQLPFPGDPVNSVPATNSFLYHNGNDLGGDALVWQQTATGLVIGTTYRFRFYASNMYEPSTGQNAPLLLIKSGGTNGLPDGVAAGGTVTLDEASTANSTALNGWKRVEYSFVATSVTMTFKIVDASASANGDEVAVTAIGLEICEKDTDQDCIADIDDIDDDNDGILDVIENGGYDALQDCDNDGIPNYLDPTPGCAALTGNDIYGNPFKPLTFSDCNGDGINDFFDWDHDGVINELDLDSDNDGILDVQEARDPRATDNNRDGMVDGIDADNDGLLSSADANDNDPTIAASIGLIPRDLDRDGLPNYLDLDSDGDGIVDNREALELDVFASAYTGLANGTNDSDHDGVRTVNYTSNDNDADNFPGFGAKGILLRDNDADGFPNPYDIDIDNDGITDNVEGQPTCSEIQPSGIDSDGDGLDDAYDVDLNPCVRKASGITPYDKEGDGTPDIRDLDTDNDGAPDINEGSGIYNDFVTRFGDEDEDGLIDQFDIFNIKTAVANFTHNVAHSEMGPNGNFNGPVPAGSNASLPQSEPGVCPGADRDWRNVFILPVGLTSFSGTLGNQVVQLHWSTTAEVNMDTYQVERSINGRDYVPVGLVKATGNGALNTAYTFTNNIESLSATTVFYRLKEIENSGIARYSNVVAFRLSVPGSSVSVYPNPAKNYFVLTITSTKEGSANVRIMDAAGRYMLTQNRHIATGTSNITYNEIKSFASGIYTVQVIIDGRIFNQKLLIEK